ncbi:hypothetical protein BJ508DRAFT_378044 [Ascobolus immersus RN42]|uniref:LysM domain-containing protein n=1 Tax=Ascobolus immersus RN42 TaxID=1160509 RepID=A0A3N4HZ57_ASCIM|nr:hypothetical protein BJ508DRAFT_378044 [Ascobolus immersus RN42]
MLIPLSHIVALSSSLSLVASLAVPAPQDNPTPAFLSDEPEDTLHAQDIVPGIQRRHRIKSRNTKPLNGKVRDQCNRWMEVIPGDTCESIETDAGMTIHRGNLKLLNPFINAGCTNLWVGYDVCVGAYHPPNGGLGPLAIAQDHEIYTAASAASTNSRRALPDPIQPLAEGPTGRELKPFPTSELQEWADVYERCQLWMEVYEGDTCESIEEAAGLEQHRNVLRSLNPVINPECNNIWAGRDLCVDAFALEPLGMVSSGSVEESLPIASAIPIEEPLPTASAIPIEEPLPTASSTPINARSEKPGYPWPPGGPDRVNIRTRSEKPGYPWPPGGPDRVNIRTRSEKPGYPWPPGGPDRVNIRTRTLGKRHHRVKFGEPTLPRQGLTHRWCSRWIEVLPGDTCESIAADAYITAWDMKRYYNDFIREDCTNLWVGYDICVGAAHGGYGGLPPLPDIPRPKPN